jgi:hypothetical protein
VYDWTTESSEQDEIEEGKNWVPLTVDDPKVQFTLHILVSQVMKFKMQLSWSS